MNMRPEKYLKGLSLDPAKTIRLGIVDVKGKETLQMMIPNEMLNDKGGGLDLVVNCEDPEKNLELPTHKVDYSEWANVVGEKYAPAESWSSSSVSVFMTTAPRTLWIVRLIRAWSYQQTV